MPGILPARSEAAATESAVAASEETGETSRSSPSPAPSGRTGAPGHTAKVEVAGSFAGRAAVSIAGGLGSPTLPAGVIAATAAIGVAPHAMAVRGGLGEFFR